MISKALMRKLLFLFIILLFSACSNEHVDRRVDAYSKAGSKVISAKSSDELVRISYDLYHELVAIDAELGPLDSISSLAVAGDEDCKELVELIDVARSSFEKELLKKEMMFYVSMGKK